MQTVTLSASITREELANMAQRMYGDLVKGVVDIEKQRMVIDAELHADEEKELLEQGSQQSALWGINLYPEFFGTDDWLGFDSMINLRPAHNNRSRHVEDPAIRQKISEIVQ